MSKLPANVELYDRIHELVVNARDQLRQTVNTAMVQTYWDIGRMIIEEEQAGENRAAYGQQQLAPLSRELTDSLGKGFSISNLKNMRRFYQLFPIRQAVPGELSWTHYCILMRVENIQAREWYVQEAISENWSSRALERQIGTLYYERLLSSKARVPVEAEAKTNTETLALNPQDYLRDPYVLDFLNLPAASVLESELEQALIDNLQEFLLELGKGFAFVERQQRISTADGDFYIDLVFYNYHLKCFLLIDLKMHKLSHQDVG